MKKIFIVLTFIFISLLSFADNTNVGVRIPLGEQKVELDPSLKMLMGLTKVENDPKYKKLVDYVEDNLTKKGIVKYSGAINLKKGAMEIFSENGVLLSEEKLPDEFMTMISFPLNFEDDKEKVKKMLKEAYENPAYVTISKNNGKPKIYMERTMGPAEEKIKIIDEVILKRELTEAEKKELLSLENDKLIEKYKSYIESESSKGYQNNKLIITKEFKNLTETAVMYDKDNSSVKMEIKYKDNSLKNGTARSYTNNKLVQEMVFENSTAILIREYDETGKVIKETLYRNDKEIKKAKKVK